MRDRVRILLRETRFGLFYAAPDLWVRDISGALEFESVSVASGVVRAEGLKGMEIVSHYEQSNREFVTENSSGEVSSGKKSS
jgi:hypothetical protein